MDAIGFKEVQEFIKPINPLRSIEDTVEQNDNQFDGLINNVPTKDMEKTRDAAEAAEDHEDKKPQKESVKQRLKKTAEKSEVSKTLAHKTAEMER